MPAHERFGWSMFIVSGLFFLTVGVRADDWLTVAGSVVWMIGCASFLVGAKR